MTKTYSLFSIYARSTNDAALARFSPAQTQRAADPQNCIQPFSDFMTSVPMPPPDPPSLARAHAGMTALGIIPKSLCSVEVTIAPAAPTRSICILTDFELLLLHDLHYFFRPHMSIRWIHIERITVIDKHCFLGANREQITLTFNEEAQLSDFMRNLTDVLSRCLTDAELKAIGLVHSPHSTDNQLGAFCRFLSFLGPLLNADPADVSLVENLLRFRRPSFKLSEFRNPLSVSYPFFQMLPLCTSLETLDIAASETHLFAPHFATIVSHIKFLRIELEANSCPVLLQLLTHHSDLEGLSLGGAALTRPELNSLQAFVVEKKLSALEFRSQTDFSEMQLFLKPSVTGCLTSLSLREVAGLDLAQLFPLIPHTHHLCLIKCSIDVIDGLARACSHPRLTTIVLSSNTVSDRRLTFSVPDRLKNVVIDHITLKSPELLYFLFNSLPSDSFLSLRHLMVVSASGDKFFDEGRVPDSRIVALNWDGSPVWRSFEALLPRLTRLTSLSLSYCLPETSPRLACRIAEFAATSRTLTRLVVRGSERRFLGKALPPFLRRLKRRTALTELDIAGSRGRADALGPLKEFVSSNQSLRSVVVDGALPHDQMVDFCGWAAIGNHAAVVRFPECDISPSADSEYRELLRPFTAADGWTVAQAGNPDARFWDSRKARVVAALFSPPDSAGAFRWTLPVTSQRPTLPVTSQRPTLPVTSQRPTLPALQETEADGHAEKPSQMPFHIQYPVDFDEDSDNE